MPLSLGRVFAGLLRGSFAGVRHSSSSPPPPSSSSAPPLPPPTQHHHLAGAPPPPLSPSATASDDASVATGSPPATPRRRHRMTHRHHRHRHRHHRHATHCHPGMLLCPTALPRRRSRRRRQHSAAHDAEHARARSSRLSSSRLLKKRTSQQQQRGGGGGGGDADGVCYGGGDDDHDDEDEDAGGGSSGGGGGGGGFVYVKAPRRRRHLLLRGGAALLPKAATQRLSDAEQEYDAEPKDDAWRPRRARERSTGQMRQEQHEARISATREKTRGKYRCDVDRLPSLSRRHRQHRKDAVQLKSDHQEDEGRALRPRGLRSAASAPAAVSEAAAGAAASGVAATAAAMHHPRGEEGLRRRRTTQRETEIPMERSRGRERPRRKRSTKRPQGFAMVLLRAAGRALESQSLARKATIPNSNILEAIGTESSSQGTCSTNVAPPSPPRALLSPSLTYQSRSVARGSPIRRRCLQKADIAAVKCKAGGRTEAADRAIASAAPADRNSCSPSASPLPPPPLSATSLSERLQPPSPPLLLLKPPPLPSPPATESSKIPPFPMSHRQKLEKKESRVFFSEKTTSISIATNSEPSATSPPPSIVCDRESTAASSVCNSPRALESPRTNHETSKGSSPVSSERQESSRATSPPLNLESSRLTPLSNSSTKSSKSATSTRMARQLPLPAEVLSVHLERSPNVSPQPAMSSRSLSPVRKNLQIPPYLDSPSPQPTSSPICSAKPSNSSCAISGHEKSAASTAGTVEGKSPSPAITQENPKEILQFSFLTEKGDSIHHQSHNTGIIRVVPDPPPMESRRRGVLSSPPPLPQSTFGSGGSSTPATGTVCAPSALDCAPQSFGSPYWPLERRESDVTKPAICEDKRVVEDLGFPPSSAVLSHGLCRTLNQSAPSIDTPAVHVQQPSYSYDSYSEYPQYNYNNAYGNTSGYQQPHQYGYHETYSQQYGYNRTYENPYSEQRAFSPLKYNSDHLSYVDLPIYSGSLLDRAACSEVAQFPEGRDPTESRQSEEKISEETTFTEVTLFTNPESEIGLKSEAVTDLVGRVSCPKNLGIPMDTDPPPQAEDAAMNMLKSSGKGRDAKKSTTPIIADKTLILSNFDSSEDEVAQCKLRPRDGGGDGLRTMLFGNISVTNEESGCSWDEATSDDPADSDCTAN